MQEKINKHMSKIIGSKIKFLRKKHRQTQKDLGDKLGLTFQQVQKYENGTSSLSVDRLYEVAKIFNVTPTELMQDDNKVYTINDTSININEQENYDKDFIEEALQYIKVIDKNANLVIKLKIINMLIKIAYDAS